MEQKQLGRDQLASFYHDEFVESQYAQLVSLLAEHRITLSKNLPIVDIGGGVGHFARKLLTLSDCVRVYDTDPEAIGCCISENLAAESCDALNPRVSGDEQLVCFNLVLHHLVGEDEAATKGMQTRAISFWSGGYIFVQEYCYESYFMHLSGKLIYLITKSCFLSSIAEFVSRFVPQLKANTFGVGVRFRSRQEWVKLFEGNGYKVVGMAKGSDDGVALPLRALLIKAIRRDGFLLMRDT